MNFARGFKARANRIALSVRKQMSLSEIDPIDPIAVCEFFDVSVFEMTSLPCDCSAFTENGQGRFSAVTVPCGGKTGIVHNDTHHPLRQRSNICHELAHLFLGHQHVPPLNERGERAHDGGIEAEANFLGGCLLLPNEAAIYVVSKGLVSQARTIYGVSKPMLEYRLRVSGAHLIYKRRLDTV